MKRLLLMILLALLAIPTLAQTTSGPVAPHRTTVRDPFLKPTAEQLKNMKFTEPVDVTIQADGKLASTLPPAETATQSYAVMQEPDASPGQNAMWVLGGIAALGLIGALAYVILGMGSHDNTTVYSA